MFRTLKEDLDAVMERDPAARSRLEVFFLYSGFKAVRSHRKANWCYRHNLKFLARWISQRSRKKTGIEIHPAPRSAGGCLSTTAWGVVIGETTQIGDNCTLYQDSEIARRQGYRQAPPHLGGQRAHRRGSQGAGALHRGGQRPGGRRRRGAGRRPGRGHRRGRACPGGAHQREKVPAKPPRHPCDDMDQIHVADPVSMELCRPAGGDGALGKAPARIGKSGAHGGLFVKRPGFSRERMR